jgi:Pyruvate/2-oxoacid:ferredoxin oxidoreductase delta subunit
MSGKSQRTIIKIDEEKCTGCGNCIPGCPEGALQIIDGKARLISDLFCDGLGACIGSCPVDAIKTEVREAEMYNESKVMDNIVKAGKNTIKAHLEHLKHHGEIKLYNEAESYLKNHGIENPLKTGNNCSSIEHHGCPGSRALTLDYEKTKKDLPKIDIGIIDEKKIASELTQWPIQIKLLPIQAPFFQNADLLIAADCVGFSNPNFHKDLLRGKKLLVGCPKLDDSQFYMDKLAQIFALNDIKSVTVAMMEVPCCRGLSFIVENALKAANKQIPVEEKIYSLQGEIKPKTKFF